MPRRLLKPHTLLPLLSGVLAFAECAPPRLYASWWNPWQHSPPPTTPVQRGANVKVRFQGASAFSERQLRAAIEEQLTRIRTEGLSRPNADDASYYTAVFYHQNGFSAAEVNYAFEGDSLLLNIKEGPLARLRFTAIEGNHSLPSSRLLALLTSVTSERLRRSESNVPFVLDEIQMGASRIADLYQSEGFLEAKVDSPEVTLSPDGTIASVHLIITEGKQYHFGNLHLRGEPTYAWADLLKEMEPVLTKPYTPRRQVALQNVLESFYTSRGHFLASVDIEADAANATSDGKVPVLITIHPGPIYRFQGIESQGTSRLRPSWLVNRLASLEGRPFSPDLLQRKQQDLLSSGLFDSLTITPVPQPNEALHLRVNATESLSRELGLSLGYGSYEGAQGGIRIANRNLFGHGLLGSVELNISQRSLALETSLSDPWLFETRTEFVTRTFIRSRVELGYEKRDAGIHAELSRRLLDPLRAAAFGQIRTVEITASQIPSIDLGSTAYQVGTVGLSLTWDKRDNAINPSSGWIAALLTDTNTLSSGATFARTSGRISYHHPLPGRVRFALSTRFGVLSQRNAVPIDERYFLGGSTTVRSFQERELGAPGNNAFPTGGSAYSLVNAETDFPLWQNLRGAVFFDSGSLAPKGGEIPTSNFRSAIGIGLRYALPVGPVRFDVGVNPDRQQNESWGAVHLSFGFAF